MSIVRIIEVEKILESGRSPRGFHVWKDKATPDIATNSTTKTKKHTKKGLCYNCHEPWHLAKVCLCPTKKAKTTCIVGNGSGNTNIIET